MQFLYFTDPTFLADYLAQNITAPELVSISDNTGIYFSFSRYICFYMFI